jgi:uncharacterized protein YcbK (DUF882 family)
MKHFKFDEFKCPCCGKATMRMEFCIRLDEAREVADTPFIINSAFRCPDHNWKVGGSLASSHIMGCAADLRTKNSTERYRILHALMKVGFKRIGIADTFIHVDMDPSKTANVIWTY